MAYYIWHECKKHNNCNNLFHGYTFLDSTLVFTALYQWTIIFSYNLGIKHSKTDILFHVKNCMLINPNKVDGTISQNIIFY